MDTSLHIAICDSDPGDRKQMERLLGRESDKRVNTTGNFYLDTFGSAGALINAPLVYDVYFLDATDEVCNSYDIAVALREKGVLSPIVYCISKIDYHESGELLPNSVFINKPIKVDELSLLLDKIIEQKKDSYIPTIEIRNNYDTFYVEEKSVVYFCGKGFAMEAHMDDGTVKHASTFLSALWHDVYTYPTLKLASKEAIINIRHISEIKFNSVIMDNGEKIKCKHSYMSAIKSAYESYKNGN